MTRRTIERDLAALRNAGVPPYATAGRTAIGKLLDLLDEPGRVAVDSLRDRFRVAVPDTHPVLPPSRRWTSLQTRPDCAGNSNTGTIRSARH